MSKNAISKNFLHSEVLVVLQPTSLCNLNCAYCYVPDRLNKAKMSIDIFKEIVFKTFKSSICKKKFRFLWHSGEPLTMGIGYYQEAVDIIKGLCPKEMNYSLHIQTNGTLVNEQWIDFFKKHKFNVGVSIDGPKVFHDKHRRTWGNKDSHASTLRGLELIRDSGLSFGVICVLTEDSIEHPDAMYDFFRDHGVNSISFNLEEKDGDNTQSTLFDNPETNKMLKKYQEFMSRIYDRWMNDSQKIEIREITKIRSSIKHFLNNASWSPLSQESNPFAIISIARNGDISLFSPELIIGVPENRRKFVVANFADIESLDEIASLDTFKNIYEPIKKGIEMCAKTCQYFSICGGGSPSNKFAENGTFTSTETKYCKFQQQGLAEVLISKMNIQTS